MKRSFFQAAVTSILLYGCTTWTLTKRLEKKLDGNYTRMLRAILNKSWRQHPTRHQLYGHLPPITKTIQVRRTRHAGHCWRSRDELIRDVLLRTPTHGRAKAGRPARTYIQQLCEDTGCCPEDLPWAMKDRKEWRERVRDIRATSTTWWWWNYFIISCFQIHCFHLLNQTCEKIWLYFVYIWSTSLNLPIWLYYIFAQRFKLTWQLPEKVVAQPNQKTKYLTIMANVLKFFHFLILPEICVMLRFILPCFSIGSHSKSNSEKSK